MGKNKKSKETTSKNIREQVLNCDRCGKQHKIKVDFSKLSEAQLAGREPVLNNFVCPNIALMHRVASYAIDTRVNIFKNSILKEEQERSANHFKAEWGEINFADKMDRFIKLDLSFLGIPEEYYGLLNSVVSTYCCGYFYPAMTSAGALGERILNRLIIKTRDHFKSSEHYKKVWNKKSFEQWDYPVTVLKEWEVISDKVADLFLILKQYRNDSIHYNDGYDFEKNSHNAVKALANIIDTQFNYVRRKDLFWVFNVPGEIWVKSEATDNPFVKEFILPYCLELTPYCEPMSNPPIKGVNVPLKPLSDEEFIKLRIQKQEERKRTKSKG